VSLDDDRLLALYNAELIALAGRAMLPKRLDAFDAQARAVSPICGSEIEVEIKLQNGRVTAFGFEVEACALTKAVVAVMADAIIGKTRDDIARAGRELEDMLSGAAVLPSGDWHRLSILAPVQDYKARHNSILLPFEAVEKAFVAKEQGDKK
jgi:NifU-like protein involved in Fe-S cluster formation